MRGRPAARKPGSGLRDRYAPNGPRLRYVLGMSNAASNPTTKQIAADPAT